MTVLQIDTLWQQLHSRGRADYLVLPDKTVSFADMLVCVRRWLAQYDALAIQPGDRILIRSANEVAAISCWLAAVFDGAVPVMVSPETPDSRLMAVAVSAGVSAIVCDGEAAAAPLLPGAGQVFIHPAARAVGGWRALVAKADLVPGLAAEPASRAPRLPADPHGLAYLLYTSGTTASPAGVMVTRDNLCANLATIARLFGIDSKARIFNDMVLAHADGLVQGFTLAAATGCALIRSGGFTLGGIEDWLNRVRRERATHVITVPTIWAMIDQYAAHDDYFDAPECLALMSVAAKLPDDLWQRLEQRFRRPLFNQYGLTETVTSALYAGPHAEMGGFGTVGKAIDCEARIADGASEGELQLRGRNIVAGYWNNPERTAASFTSDGWFKSGDLARQRADGSFEILGRLKHVILSGGFLIRPDEIDEAMLRHAQVRESVTLGMADALFGEVPVTVVVGDAALDEVALTDHARQHLEGHKVPKRFLQVDAIPRGDAGKPQLAALRTQLAQAVAGTSAAGDIGHEARVIEVAASVFRISPDAISLRTRQGDVPGWDSFSQINLIMAVEAAFGITIPASRIAAVRSLADLVRVVEELQP